MKLTRKQTVTVSFLVLLAFSALFWARSQEAEAAFGNYGIPVRCYASSVEPNESNYLSCVSADGTPFTDGQRVPAGYYLMVTDIVITPDAGTTAAGITSMVFYDAYGASSRAYSMTIRSGLTDTYSEHWSVPYMVLPADHRIEVVGWWFNAQWVDVRVSGLLVTNVNYLPLATR